jgi:two-component system nitrogen regulation response regulator GlnG
MADPRQVLVCHSPAMRALTVAIDEVAATDTPVLVLGEPGTGRELVARLLHVRSPRARKPLVTVRAGAPRAVGHDDGAGWPRDACERAVGGSLLVKDDGELSRAGQRRLARELSMQAERKAPDVRILATTDPGLDRVADAGMWHRGLFQRLAAATLEVPLLRERLEDVEPLATRFLREYTRELGRGKRSFAARAIDRLACHTWPGNVAELKAVVRRLAIGVRGRTIGEGDVDAVLPSPVSIGPADPRSLEELVRTRLADFLRRVEGYSLTGVHDDIMGQVERPLISLVLEHAKGNQVRAAEILGLSRNTLRKKLADHGLLAAAEPKRASR